MWLASLYRGQDEGIMIKIVWSCSKKINRFFGEGMQNDGDEFK